MNVRFFYILFQTITFSIGGGLIGVGVAYLFEYYDLNKDLKIKVKAIKKIKLGGIIIVICLILKVVYYLCVTYLI